MYSDDVLFFLSVSLLVLRSRWRGSSSAEKSGKETVENWEETEVEKVEGETKEVEVEEKN